MRQREKKENEKKRKRGKNVYNKINKRIGLQNENENEKYPSKHYWHATCVGNFREREIVIHSHNSNIRVLLNGSLVIQELLWPYF